MVAPRVAWRADGRAAIPPRARQGRGVRVPGAAPGSIVCGVIEILEQGAVSFLAVPRAGVEETARPADVARFFVVLAPRRGPLRRLSVRRRRLPDARRGQRFYAHVDRLATAPARLTADVREDGREGAARARPRVLAVGRYTLARHGDHVHLAYALARACRRGQLAASLGVGAGGSFLLCVFRRSLPPTRRPHSAAPLAPATPDRLDVLAAPRSRWWRGSDRATGASGSRPGQPIAWATRWWARSCGAARDRGSGTS